MAVQRTLTLIKPDGVAQNNIGDVIRVFEENRFQIVATKMQRLTKQQAEGFYAVHRGATLRGNCPIRTRPPLERVFNKLSHRDLEILTEEVPSHQCGP